MRGAILNVLECLYVDASGFTDAVKQVLLQEHVSRELFHNWLKYTEHGREKQSLTALI